MSQMKVLDLLQCMFWGAGSVAPLALMYIVGRIDEENRVSGKGPGSAPWMFFLSLAAQAAFAVCVWKAAGGR